LERQLRLRWTHQANIERYRRLLKTYLTEHEREFIQNRLAEEMQALQPTINKHVGEASPLNQ
jgi:predicted house-cleaning noncanonical NTP pyrophosphatase (MazG superfamily)